ncbi:MAG: efflux transporter outer membrane subunit [Gammaproteobacteria bacterium]
MNRRYWLPLLVLLGGCQAVGPDYAGPPATPADGAVTFPSAAVPADAPPMPPGEPPAAWWKLLEDPELDALVAAAQDANFDLRIAAANVAAAEAVLAQVDTRRRPTANVGASTQMRRDPIAQFPRGDPDNPLPALPFTTLGFDLNWELDLFGRIRRSIEAAAADLGSLEAVRHDVLTSVLAGVARAYLDLRGNQARIEVAERNVAVQQQTLDLVVLLNREGAATDLDVARARTQLLASQATIPRLQAALTAALNRLTTLTAQTPGALTVRLAPRRPLPSMPAFVAVGAPGDLVRRRPDIRAAERALAGATARIGVATADLFPTVTLLGRAGLGASHLSDLASRGAPFFALGPSITWNLFDREAIYARIRAADSNAEAALVRYQAVVTGALEEVDSALSAYRQERQRRLQLNDALTASREASSLARLRYQEGIEDFLTVLDAERNLLQIEDQLAQSQIALAQALVDIHLALGGGWDAAGSGTGKLGSE